MRGKPALTAIAILACGAMIAWHLRSRTVDPPADHVEQAVANGGVDQSPNSALPLPLVVIDSERPQSSQPLAATDRAAAESKPGMVTVPTIRLTPADTDSAETKTPDLSPTFRRPLAVLGLGGLTPDGSSSAAKGRVAHRPIPIPAEDAVLTKPDKESAVPDAIHEAEIIYHEIADGDTLQALAARYLGDASRSDEIFETNSSSLAEPELLPIGMRIKIMRSSDNKRAGSLRD